MTLLLLVRRSGLSARGGRVVGGGSIVGVGSSGVAASLGTSLGTSIGTSIGTCVSASSKISADFETSTGIRTGIRSSFRTGVCTTFVTGVGSLRSSRLVASSGNLRSLGSGRASVGLGLATSGNLRGLSLVATSGNFWGFRSSCARVVAACAGNLRGVSARVAAHARNLNGSAVVWPTSEETANASASKEASKTARGASLRATVATKTSKASKSSRATGWGTTTKAT
jgi:hypothetical protein